MRYAKPPGSTIGWLKKESKWWELLSFKVMNHLLTSPKAADATLSILFHCFPHTAVQARCAPQWPCELQCGAIHGQTGMAQSLVTVLRQIQHQRYSEEHMMGKNDRTLMTWWSPHDFTWQWHAVCSLLESLTSGQIKLWEDTVTPVFIQYLD